MTTGIDARPRVYHAPADWTFPSLGRKAVPDGARVDVDRDDAAWSVYDTDGRDLEQYGATLSRRGTDEWRLHVDGVVTTLRAGARTVPAPLRDLLLGVRGGAPLRRVDGAPGGLVTRVVVDGDRILGEIDELVQAAGDGASRRRIEVTALEAAFGEAVDRRLRKAGAGVLKADVPQPATVGDAVTAFLRTQRAVVLRGDVRLRHDPDSAAAVHPTRVAIRRLRSALRIVDVFDHDATVALDDELRWLSATLGTVRDVDVLRTHLAGSLERLASTGQDVTAVRSAVERALDERYTALRARLGAALRGRRYLALLRELRAWQAHPPLLDSAAAPVVDLADYAETAVRTMRRRLRRAHDVESTHRARKSAKRARYVNELAAATLGGKRGARAARAAAGAKATQTELGDRQDAAMAADFLMQLAGRRGLSARAAFGVGALWSAEHRAAQS